MEQNLSITPKRLLHIVRVMLFLIRKNLSKTKIMLDVKYMMSKRGKIAMKVLNHLTPFYHHQQQIHLSSVSKTGPYTGHLPCSTAPKVYVYSCKSTPYRNLMKLKRNRHVVSDIFVDDEDENLDAVDRVLNRMLACNNPKNDLVEEISSGSFESRFGQSSMIRELRVTDSPFLSSNEEVDNHVDEAAEEFIKRFYSQLQEQDC